MALPDMLPPAQPAQQHSLLHHDGTRRTVFCTDAEVAFPDGHLIVSRVDTAGLITHANDAFVEMSGYLREQLLGAPHHILRHPDMPRAAFADLWATVGAGRKWHGYVKNLRGDGACYWVYATVVPNVRQGVVAGYTSVRRKPSRAKVAEYTALYAQMRAAEPGAAA
ncbi:PAS domain-containing protein [Aquabacterium sp. OR-4]|uniref:PAS domain-containing protein n=1 Tax=Aquabacterium sp. OR-4 TaxID=2978127 RepID=UPI0021B4CE97|nr:PAS domain-containing protein [Aquabacterium sp. OR-4]MDT7837705.1 PAS domain-containing protein [Aquabacterium sp. OR-4]